MSVHLLMSAGRGPLDDAAAKRAVTTARWRIHDQLVRGNPTRVERREPSGS